MTDEQGLTYAEAGVDIDAGNELVTRIGTRVEATRRPEVLTGLGGFGGLFELPVDRYKRPVLVSATDGVGTKLRLAIEAQRYDTLGIDLVAMCANDVLVTGGEPLFFLDYYATAQLDTDVAAAVIDGIAAGCEQAGAALIGGETAEMPGMYQPGDFDLAGFCVGAVERDAIVDGSNVTAGDVVIGLASSGPHANGYSLIRRVIDEAGADLTDTLDNRPLVDHLMAPTRIYAHAVRQLQATVSMHAMAHVTGGGLADNLARVLPTEAAAQIHENRWERPAIFDWLAEHGGISADEMRRTFNNGIGFCVVVPAEQSDTALQALANAGETAQVIGEIEHQRADAPSVSIG
ncbi:phosphoribosylformylglycinamidine cyclo-ligase [Salinisphaera sp. USBA-960]|uniref:phosphoribosylformylglycinamidine cyclo-ligase n=1 Tax=Salinisphaera orenii TaxID=856731 RepID=UPI000DBE3E10|nr:phosphoribosylformylglycinamidine cyclo-ligase [Salifodinibacter halophilus]NNC26621.1 phosphoribosylformylglycinamidine cyclo-ligase [Salifodinibacter halophilus]